MSDLLGNSSQSGGRAAPSMRTPRDIMADRRAREARREAEANQQREEEQRSSEHERRRAAAAATKRMTRPEPSSSSARVSEDIQSDLPARQRSQSQSAQQPPNTQTMPGHQRSYTTTQSGARISSAPNPPSTAKANDLREDVPPSTTRTNFPHAFERWEDLSSHWEGLTSYWLRKIDGNTDEIRHNVPSAAAMQRQIQDLSAAGANLFHGLVELQRLRASSERKFKRWFYEMRAEQEKWQEDRADLLGQIQDERNAKEQALASVEQARRDTRQQENIANEARRELNISKNEARRAWEDLGTMEAARLGWIGDLRQGLPTVIGGVQVVPMHASSHPGSEHRATTGENPEFHQARSQQSPQVHQPQQQYQPIVPDVQYQDDEPSPTDTDPFTGPTRAGQYLHHEPDVQQLGSDDNQHYPAGSTPASTSTARTTISPQQQRRDLSPHAVSPSIHPNVTTTRPVIQPSPSAATGAARDEPELFYQQPPGKVYLQSSPGSGGARSKTLVAEAAKANPELGSRPSYGSNTTEGTEYEIDEQGNVRRDAQGRPIVYRNPDRSAQHNASHVSSEEYDTAADVARERELAARYGVNMPPPQVPHAPTTSAEAMASFATSTADDADLPAGYRAAGPADYEGAGYGDWEALQSRHHHPTRLSDVLEEDERSRTTAE